MMPIMILRVVPKGLPAAGWDDDEDECDMGKACDLVYLVEETRDGLREERELERKSFVNGHEASAFMGRLFRCDGGGRR